MALARRACPMLSPPLHRAKSPSRKLIIKRSGTGIRACARRAFALTKFEGSAFAFVAPASSRPGWDILRLVRLRGLVLSTGSFVWARDLLLLFQRPYGQHRVPHPRFLRVGSFP